VIGKKVLVKKNGIIRSYTSIDYDDKGFMLMKMIWVRLKDF